MVTERVLVIIDGSNFFHKLIDLKFSQKGLINFRYDLFVHDLVGSRKLSEARYHVGAVRTEVGNNKSFSLFKEQRIVEYFGFSHKPSFALIRFADDTKLWGVKELSKYLK